MKNFRVIRHQLKEPVIYKSKHEPFLSGNIARGVIEMISRKAIPPLVSQMKAICNKKSAASGRMLTFKKYTAGKNSFFLSFISKGFLYPDNSKKFSYTPFVYICRSVCQTISRLITGDKQREQLSLSDIHRYMKNEQTGNTLSILYY